MVRGPSYASSPLRIASRPIQLVLEAVELGLLSVAALQRETQAEAVLVIERMVELGEKSLVLRGTAVVIW